MKYNNDQFIVPAPTFNGGMFSPFGRMTRNRPAVLITKNLTNCVVMFFKDYWREHSEHTKTEAEVYNLLATNEKTKACLYFAKMHAGGDAEVDGRPATTIGYDDTDMPWTTGKRPIRHLTAHFIFLTTIGRNLKMFRSARELVSCMADAMEAHQLAYDELHILHRDISAGNILISTDKPDRGILIDWDHCIFMDNLTEDRTTRVQRTGTWQFMSAHMTANPEGATHGLVDDRESALHVLMYMSLRHLAHNKANSYAMQDLLHMFDDYLEVEGSPYRQGTMSKLNFMTSGVEQVVFGRDEMNQLIRLLCHEFAARYEDTTLTEPKETPFNAHYVRMARLQASERQARLNNISQDPKWLCAVFRYHAGLLPGDIDHIDNTKLIKPNRKRALADDLCDEADGSKLISTHDSMAGSIDADMDLAPPVETPPHKKQRSSRK
ncbi:Fungal-type protein kinase domain-containing protein [Pleurotus pulmonarius]